jgi:hypothetical protein
MFNRGMNRPRVFVLILSTLALAALAGSALAESRPKKAKTCKHGRQFIRGHCRATQSPPIASGEWSGSVDPGLAQMKVNAAKGSVAFSFDGAICSPITAPLKSGDKPTVGALPSDRPGTSISLSGSLTRPFPTSNEATQVLDWELKGRFVTWRRFVGTIHYHEVVHDIQSDLDCSQTDPIEMGI